MNGRIYCSGCGRSHEIHLGCNEAHALYQLGDLLAVIHRDGGHYTGQHGLERSTLDAANVVIGLRQQKDEAYAERNQVVVALAWMARALGYNAGVGQHPLEDKAWEDDWRTIVFIDMPGGQCSWHIHDSEKHLVEGLPVYTGKWDGHTTEEKYERLRAAH